MPFAWTFTVIFGTPPADTQAQPAEEPPTLAANDARYAIPDCSGGEPHKAARAFDRGRRAFFDAMKQAPPDQELLSRSLAAFEAQCAAGDGMALERIASVLVVLGRNVDAARTFDRFLELHPKTSLQKEDLARIQANERLYYEHVGSVRIQANDPGAEVRIGGGLWQRTRGQPIRVAPGQTLIETRAAGRIPNEQMVTISEGETVTLEVELATIKDKASPPATRAPSNHAKPKVPPEAPASKPAGGGVSTHAALFVSAGAAAGIGFVGLGYSNQRFRAYRDGGCPDDPTREDCKSVETQFNLARGVQIGAFIAAGTLATVGGFLWLRHIAQQPDASALCTPTVHSGPTLACMGRF